MTEVKHTTSEVQTDFPHEHLHFDVSTGLKRVIGRDLITDDEVAIFELVKNSFDARASLVQIRIDGESIWIVDNGDGMSLNDLTNKWLFVAYSAKRDDTADTFRRRNRYPNVGTSLVVRELGRFSSDRLGSDFLMQTRPQDHTDGPVHQVQVNWDSFENDDTRQFGAVPVDYTRLPGFNLPNSLEVPVHGTAIQVPNTRVQWNRARILHLKASLAKLINPFGASIDGFRIEIVAPADRDGDDRIRQSAVDNLLRELTFIVEAHDYAWAKRMKRLLLHACHEGSRTLTK